MTPSPAVASPQSERNRVMVRCDATHEAIATPLQDELHVELRDDLRTIAIVLAGSIIATGLGVLASQVITWLAKS